MPGNGDDTHGPAGTTATGRPARDLGLEGAHAATPEDAVAALAGDPVRGLTDAEAEGRLARVGPNRFVSPRKVTFGHVLVDEITEPMMVLLVAVAVLYSVWGQLEDTVAIVLVIAAVVLVEVFAEFRAKSVIVALGRLTAPTASVLRDGVVRQVPTEELVPGDVVPLRAGSRVPADVRLLETWGLRVDESALTGESVPVDKDSAALLVPQLPAAERTTMVFAGTTVAAGRARGLVTATGMATELGRITGLVVEAKPPRTALQQAMRDLSRNLAILAIGFSVLVPLIGLIGGAPWRDMVLTGLTMAFAVIPEELPIIITLVLGLGAYRLSRRHGLVRRLRAAETLGTVTVIATDKTGTLTENRMAVTDLAPDGVAEDRLLALGAACHDATVESGDDGPWFSGDPTDVAFLDAARDRGLLPGEAHGVEGDAVLRFAFDAHRESMTVVYRRTDRRVLVVTKGAPEALLARCTARGGHRVLTSADRTAATAQADRMAGRGLRVIAVAIRTSADLPATVEEAETELTFVGLVGLADPPRPEVAEAMRRSADAGVRVVMVTGDHPACARAIAEEIGLDVEGGLLTGRELDRLDDEALAAAVARRSVFARVTPEHKLRLVEALQARGDIVAVTGDGINDAPALARANVGIAMGASGTDVARDAADLVLADDNFATITRALREGRTLFDNLHKGVKYYLACKVGLVATTAAGALVGLPIPFAPIQIVVLEMFMDIAGSATFAVEPAERDTMSRPPRDPQRRFLDRPVVASLMAGGASLFAAVGGIYLVASWSGQSTATAQTLAFLAWMVGYVALAWVMRSERTPLPAIGLLSNRFLPAWTAVTAASIAVMMFVPFLRDALRLTPISGTQWTVVILVPLVATSWIEIAKWWPSRAAAPNPAPPRRRRPAREH